MAHEEQNASLEAVAKRAQDLKGTVLALKRKKMRLLQFLEKLGQEPRKQEMISLVEEICTEYEAAVGTALQLGRGAVRAATQEKATES